MCIIYNEREEMEIKWLFVVYTRHTQPMILLAVPLYIAPHLTKNKNQQIMFIYLRTTDIWLINK